jgi:uncharacterized membrane protein YdjX (TVP38/TMEM64 family)
MKQFLKRFAPLFIILIGIAVVYFTGVYKYVSFESLKENHRALESFLVQHPISVPILFMLTYIVFTALSIPGGIFLTLIGGYLFPQPLSTIYVVISATCGAILIFLAARTALGDSLRKRAGPFLTKMESGFKNNAASYLLFLRFVPIFPFWAVNLAPAFFGVPLITFVWTTLVGITPGSLVFTLAGGGLQEIFDSNQPFSVSLIFALQIRIALVLLGVLALVPIIVKKLRKKSD